MVPFQLVMCLHVVAMWFFSSMIAQAAPSLTHVLREANFNDIFTKTTHPRNTTPRTWELRPREGETWQDEEFLSYVKDVLAKRCPHKADNKTCADDDAPTQVEDDFDKLNPSQKDTIRTFMGGSRDTVTCAQLVRIKTGSDDSTPENVACVLYFYDSSPIEVARPRTVS